MLRDQGLIYIQFTKCDHFKCKQIRDNQRLYFLASTGELKTDNFHE